MNLEICNLLYCFEKIEKNIGFALYFIIIIHIINYCISYDIFFFNG